MSEKHDCSATIFGPRVHSWQCTRAGVVERNGKWWCRQHDPLAKAARESAREDKWAAKRREDAAIYVEGKKIAKQLGVDDNVFYRSSSRYFESGPQRALVIDFDDCLKLIEKLGKR